ncbi:hypothetical protein DIPPA_19212 [Diplonema papillatum]|nr:hypothetical protein DIPPA_19212 [Diplonema papillatum]KAJ9465774.1 hypothetical protein DIPPA_19212 [Diplonema papillatum]
MDASDRDLGKYDYGSLMHYGNYDFSTNGEQAIISPQPIGQRSGLSAGDIATLDFMYNGCSAVFAAPVCMTNKDELEANEVDPYQEYLCQFNVEWTAGQSVYVDYSLTTTPESSTTFPPGTVMDDSSSRRVLFQPSFLDMDKVYTVAATFTAATNASISTTCSTTVKIVPAPTNVDVKTGHMSNAGTNGKVAIVLYGAGGGDALLDSPGTGDITTVVVLSKAPPETIQSASISLLNGNDWYAEYLMIGDRIAVFDRWLVSDSLQFFAGFTKSKRYSATVKTGTLSGAGTDSNIWLTVVGSQGETRAVLLNPRLSGNAFENGDTDVISFDGRDVGTISSLKVKSDGMYAAPAWYLDYIEVNSVRACFLRWIEEGTYTQAVAGSCVLKTYDVVVKTGTLSGAGTDSNIRLTIIGDKSTTNAVELNQLLSGNVFENGDTDRLTFSNRDVGNIVSLTVESDGLYAGSDWDLDSIQVNNDLVCFRRWIEEGTYTQAVLGSCDWKTYDVVVKTGTRSGAGTDSNIWLTIIGDRSTTNAVKLNPLLSGDAFENGDTDRLTFSNRDVGNIVSLQVRSDGKYAGSDWDLSYITVNSKRATFNTWIEEGTYTRTVS